MQLQDKKKLKKRKKKRKKLYFKIIYPKFPHIFFRKKIVHKMIDGSEPVEYEGIVTEVLDDNEQDEECEFTVTYDGYKDTFQVQLVKDWQEKCVIVKCKASLDEPEKMKRKISAVPSLSF